MLSKTGKYAIRAVSYIGYVGKDQRVVGIKQIIDDLNIPPAFLKKILQDLSRHVIFTSYKGPNGGFTLARYPKDISLFDIVTIIDGPDSYSSCLLGRRNCNDHSIEQCFVHDEFFDVKMRWAKFLKSNTLQLIIENIDKEGGITAI